MSNPEPKRYILVNAVTDACSFATQDDNGVTLFDFNGGFNSKTMTIPEFEALPQRELFFPMDAVPSMKGTEITLAELGL